MWAATQNHLGQALRDRVFGDPAANIAAAFACFDRALAVRTRTAVPLNWATTQHNMGAAYHICHGKNNAGAAGVDEAVACYHRALEVRTPETSPQEWALTTFSLLLALVDGERWSEAMECGRTLERFGSRWATWLTHQAAVARALVQTERALAQSGSEGSGG